MKKICFVGCMCLSVVSEIKGFLLEDDSVAGSIMIRFGGVAWNVARQCALHHDADIEMITVLSNDMIGTLAKNEMASFGIGFSHSIFVEKWKAYYNDIHSETFHYGVNDMTVLDLLSPDFLTTRLDIINGTDMLFVDENLSPQSLQLLCANVKVPIICDGTSVQKCDRIKPFLNSVSAIKLNRMEFCKMYRCDPQDISDEDTIRQLLRGVDSQVFITLGKQGSICCHKGEVYHHLGEHLNALDTLRAGDAFASAIIDGLLKGAEPREILVAGSKRACEVLKENAMA